MLENPEYGGTTRQTSETLEENEGISTPSTKDEPTAATEKLEKNELVSLLDEHQRRNKLCKQLLSLGHYCPTMSKNTHNMVKRYHAYQVHGNLTHKPLALLQDMHTP